MIPYRMNPLGISVNEERPLTLTAAADSSSVTLNAYGSVDATKLFYRLGKSGQWSAYTAGTEVPLTTTGDAVQFWNQNNTLSNSINNYFLFAMSGRINASGNIQSLINYRADCPYGCFTYLFANASSLLTAPDCPAETVADRSYWETFRGCRRLASVKLGAKTILNNTFYRTFRYCSALESIEVNFTSWTYMTDWVEGVAAAGTFIKPAALSEDYANNRIPTGWTVVNK